MSTHKKITLSIIVVTLNEAQHLERLKASIDHLNTPDHLHLETILVDGGSQDQTLQEAHKQNFSHVLELKGANIPACRNRGALEAKASWLAYVDGDCELDPDWLVDIQPFFTRKVATVLGWPAIPPDSSNWIQDAWRVHWLHKNPATEEYQGLQVVKYEAFRLMTTRNVILHREVYEKLQGFDEALPTGEDTDFFLRAYLEGFELLGLPSMRAMHHGEPKTLLEFFKQQTWHANRKSYKKIMERTGGKTGGRAPLFTTLFLLTSLLLLLGIVLASSLGKAWPLLLTLPLLLLVGGPATMIAMRARAPKYIASLCVLYALYGLARTMDMVGFFRNKQSWKTS